MTRESGDARTFIGKTGRVRIDRHIGSRHPDAGFVYPVNYGFLPGVPAHDVGATSTLPFWASLIRWESSGTRASRSFQSGQSIRP